MSSLSAIEWTDATWNPTRGCTKISPGCKNCYAKVFAERFRGVPGHAYERGFDPRLAPDKLLEPLLWKQPKKIFVNSMSDLFHEDLPDDYLVDCARVMCLAGWHVFQVLTKRAERMRELLQTKLRFAAERPHIWWGVSVEDQRHGVPRIDQLQQAPARVRFLSCEPLLGDLGQIDLRDISWVICGGESGPGARSIELSWVTNIRDQCQAAGVPFFFKQWGGVRKSKTGNRLQGRTYLEYPMLQYGPAAASLERKRFLKEIAVKYRLGGSAAPVHVGLERRRSQNVSR